jgi:hypothetical protein
MPISDDRLSTHDQDTAAQSGALTAAGCGAVFQEKASRGAGSVRGCPAASGNRLLDRSREGDAASAASRRPATPPRRPGAW